MPSWTNSSPHFIHMTSAIVATSPHTSPHYTKYTAINSADPITYTTKLLTLNQTHKHLNINQKNQLYTRFQTYFEWANSQSQRLQELTLL